jgi:hypothetical protein
MIACRMLRIAHDCVEVDHPVERSAISTLFVDRFAVLFVICVMGRAGAEVLPRVLGG